MSALSDVFYSQRQKLSNHDFRDISLRLYLDEALKEKLSFTNTLSELIFRQDKARPSTGDQFTLVNEEPARKLQQSIGEKEIPNRTR